MTQQQQHRSPNSCSSIHCAQDVHLDPNFQCNLPFLTGIEIYRFLFHTTFEAALNCSAGTVHQTQSCQLEIESSASLPGISEPGKHTSTLHSTLRLIHQPLACTTLAFMEIRRLLLSLWLITRALLSRIAALDSGRGLLDERLVVAREVLTV